jgi:hypothetical protein
MIRVLVGILEPLRELAESSRGERFAPDPREFVVHSFGLHLGLGFTTCRQSMLGTLDFLFPHACPGRISNYDIELAVNSFATSSCRLPSAKRLPAALALPPKLWSTVSRRFPGNFSDFGGRGLADIEAAQLFVENLLDDPVVRPLFVAQPAFGDQPPEGQRQKYSGTVCRIEHLGAGRILARRERLIDHKLSWNASLSAGFTTCVA